MSSLYCVMGLLKENICKMKVQLIYFAQIRQRAGTDSDMVTVPEGSTVLSALKTVDHGEGFQQLLFDESGSLRTFILVVVNGVLEGPHAILSDNDQVQFISPISGG